MRKFFIVLLLVFTILSDAHALNLSDFETPESMQVDPKTGAYYISNVNGEPLAKDA